MDTHNVSLQEAVVRYFGMMALIIIGVTTGWWVVAVFALPLFLTAITGICPIKRMYQNGKKQKPTLTAHHSEKRQSTAKAA